MANADNESVWRSSDKSDSVCRLIVNAKDISYQGKCMIFFMYHQYIDNVIRFTLIIYLLETIKPTYFI